MPYISFISLLLLSFIANSQITHYEYIENYKDFAMAEMMRSGVPASITLAQGILESDGGNSYLAREANNHFGIKCHNWDGPSVKKDDDSKDECFRKYTNVGESFRDHSDFLLKHSRYAFLFDFEMTDYKSWAKGLKKAGYATNPKYADKLIELIERYSLHNYDDHNFVADKTSANYGVDEQGDIQVKPPQSEEILVQTYDQEINPYENYYNYNNDVPYIVVDKEISVRELGPNIHLMPWQIAWYNDIGKNDVLAPGDVIYLKPKKRKAQKGSETHIVQVGETMNSISQKYAVKLKRLYKYNNIEIGSQPEVGRQLNLRKRN